ncbi:MAG: hypothetical protein HC792_06085, partial [Acaryochloridaceae cyanobacterium CSU_5_19]|nr:hypothetical protein [Acaryochloridaceae cyanobacterium CSU_5_19]
GALRIDVSAKIPTNRWLTYEVQIRDQQNKLLVAALKNAWREAGVWSEEGETGTWQEDDLQAGLDLAASQSEPITISIEILEYATTANQALQEPVPFRIEVNQGIIDTRHLWPGLIGGFILAVLTALFSRSTGTTLINKEIADSDLGDRATLGGPKQLIKVMVEIESDETSPATLNCALLVRDGNGEVLHTAVQAVPLRFSKDEDGEITSVRGKAVYYFVLEKPGSYGFYAEVTPDQPVDSTRLIVKQGVRTTGAVEVIHISAPSA